MGASGLPPGAYTLEIISASPASLSGSGILPSQCGVLCPSEPLPVPSVFPDSEKLSEPFGLFCFPILQEARSKISTAETNIKQSLPYFPPYRWCSRHMPSPAICLDLICIYTPFGHFTGYITCILHVYNMYYTIISYRAKKVMYTMTYFCKFFSLGKFSAFI